MQKNQLRELGTKYDQRRRTSKKREDTHIRRGRIERVRKWLYQDGRLITGVHVKRVLKQFSETPSRVSALPSTAGLC